MSTLIVTNIKNTSSATNNIVTNTDGSATIAGASLLLSTAVASTSVTSIDFFSIPSYVKRITVMLSGVSTNALSNYIIRMGSGSVDTTGYTSGTISVNSLAAAAFSSITSGFDIGLALATDTFRATAVLTLQNSSTYLWTYLSSGRGPLNGWVGSGEKTLSGTLDRISITTVGADTFDSGTINISYE